MRGIIILSILLVNILIAKNTYIESLIPKNYTLTEIHGDLNNDNKQEIVLNLENFKENKNKLIILEATENKQYNILFESDSVLSYPDNNGQGFMIQNIIASIENGRLVIKTNTNSGKQIIRNYYFTQNGDSFILDEFVEKIGSKCENGIIIEKYTELDIKPTLHLKDFSINTFFNTYYSSDMFQKKLTKTVSPIFVETYKKLLQLYKNDSALFKKEMLGLITYDERTNEVCSPEYYLNQYLYLDAKSEISKSNDMAFFFEQAGYYNEAIYLLKKILKKFPNRTVAYLNLGDAYWGLENKEKAKKAYQTYIKQMKESGKEKKIPTVVFERVK